MSEWDLDFYHRPLSPEPEFDVTSTMLRNSGIGREYWTATIGQIPDVCPYKTRLSAMVDSLPRDVRRGKGAIFYGNHGRGKTCASAIMLKSAMARGGQCFHRYITRLKNAYEKRWTETNRDGVQIWDMLNGSQLCTIDDLGAERTKKGYEAGDIRIIEELVRGRYDHRLTTYITTNLSLAELIESYSSIGTILLDPNKYHHVEVGGHIWRDRGKK